MVMIGMLVHALIST